MDEEDGRRSLNGLDRQHATALAAVDWSSMTMSTGS
jgi:hypothetical protein